MPRMLVFVFFLATVFVASSAGHVIAGTPGDSTDTYKQFKGPSDGLASLLKANKKSSSNTKFAAHKKKSKSSVVTRKSKSAKHCISGKKHTRKYAGLKSKVHKKKTSSKLKTAKRSANKG
jgi:hypothetical protein